MTRLIDKGHPAVIVVLGVSALIALDVHSRSDREPEPLQYRGELRAADGLPIMGAHVIGVELWDSAEHGERLCAVQAQSTAVERGKFALPLTEACAGALQRGRGAWADLEVDGERLSPRAQLLSPQPGKRGGVIAPVMDEPAAAPSERGRDMERAPRETESGEGRERLPYSSTSTSS